MSRLLMWTFSHFAVDFGCFYILFSGLKVHMGGDLETLAAGFLAYNVIAFGLQSVIGMLCDERPVWRRMSGFAGCVMVLLAVVTAAVWADTFVWAAMVIAAGGNAFFHVGGGIDVLRRSRGRMTDSGIFVSSGAMGVALGTICSSGMTAVLLIFTAAMVTGMMTCKISQEEDERHEGANFTTAGEGSFAVITGLLLAAVFIRAYAGSIIPLEWEQNGWRVIIPAAASCMGKALGGAAADRLGAARTGVISLLISLPLVCFGAENMVLSSVGIILFNMTMPITLCGLTSLMPENTGFAFGLTTLMLLLGVGITYFWEMPDALVRPAAAVLIVLAAICIHMSVNNEREERR